MKKGNSAFVINSAALKKGIAALLALATCVLPACTTALPLTGDRTASTLTTPTQPTEAALTTPSYYDAESASPNESYTPENQLKLLAERDFENGYFLIVQEEGLENAIFPENDEFLKVYADRRNRMVQEKYNVQLASRHLSADEIISELTDCVQKDVYFCDMLIVSPDLLKQLRQKELLLPLDTLPFLELNSPCISAQATAEINADLGGIYGIWGDVLRQPSDQLCVYFNETMAQSLCETNFYSTVRSGEWDFSTLLSAAELTASLEGVGGILYDGSASDLLLAASGRTSSSEEGKALLADPTYLELTEQFDQLTVPAADGDQNDPIARFISGQSLFYIGSLGEFERFSLTDEVFGILPLPKYAASDSSYPSISDGAELPVLACPLNTNSSAGTGIMLSALNAASCDEINDFFLESIEPYVRNNGTFLIFPYLIGSPHFDRKFIYG